MTFQKQVLPRPNRNLLTYFLMLIAGAVIGVTVCSIQRNKEYNKIKKDAADQIIGYKTDAERSITESKSLKAIQEEAVASRDAIWMEKLYDQSVRLNEACKSVDLKEAKRRDTNHPILVACERKYMLNPMWYRRVRGPSEGTPTYVWNYSAYSTALLDAYLQWWNDNEP